MMDDDDERTPGALPSNVPSLSNIYKLVLAIYKSQLRLTKKVETALGEPEVIRFNTPLPTPSLLAPANSTTPTTPRPSMSVKAAKGTVNLGKYTAIVIGALSVASELSRLWRPEYRGAITAILKMFGVNVD